MDINCGIIDLHFYDETQTQGFSITFRRGKGWSVWRDLESVVSNVSWEEAFDSLTTGERVRCTVFANNLR